MMLIGDEIEDFLRKCGVFKIGVTDPELGFRMDLESSLGRFLQTPQ
ncbi:MAG: hypothetical protein ACETVM_04610 [Candidatus Bathyarchaeia archaeon]